MVSIKLGTVLCFICIWGANYGQESIAPDFEGTVIFNPTISLDPAGVFSRKLSSKNSTRSLVTLTDKRISSYILETTNDADKNPGELKHYELEFKGQSSIADVTSCSTGKVCLVKVTWNPNSQTWKATSKKLDSVGLENYHHNINLPGEANFVVVGPVTLNFKFNPINLVAVYRQRYWGPSPGIFSMSYNTVKVDLPELSKRGKKLPPSGIVFYQK